jgi:DNA-binding PadR family transcriptional regulator
MRHPRSPATSRVSSRGPSEGSPAGDRDNLSRYIMSTHLTSGTERTQMGPSGRFGHADGYHRHAPPGSRRVRRGDVRDLLLAALLDGPAHGYELMQRLEERTGGRWRPSPGSVYPHLQLLEDEGLARGRDDNGRKVYELTGTGQSEAESSQARVASREEPVGPHHMALRRELRQLHAAARQVAMTGDEQQLDQAVEVVRAARQSLYRMLADS